MIVIFIDDIEDFVKFLPRRIMDEIFYEFKELPGRDLSSQVNIEIILHYLAKVDNNLILYETKVILKKEEIDKIDQEVINELQKLLEKISSEMTLVKGKIREIFLSYSS
jgi:hypothetical protein